MTVQDATAGGSPPLPAVTVVPTRRGPVEVVSNDASSPPYQDDGEDEVVAVEEEDEEDVTAPDRRRSRVKSTAPLASPPSSADRSKELVRLCESHPGATEAEIRRFLAANRTSGAASKRLAAYLKWREGNSTAFGTAGEAPESVSADAAVAKPPDSDVWNACAAAAASKLRLSIGTGDRGGPNLPRLVRIVGADEGEELLDADGRRILHVLPALLDAKIAPCSLYALTTALYLDRVLDRRTLELMSMVIDVRPGRGWPNPSPQRVVPYLRSVSKLGADMFPERLGLAVVVPMPPVAVGIWNAVKGLLDKRHVARVRLVSGAAKIRSTMPMEAMDAFCGGGVVESMERSRLSEFC